MSNKKEIINKIKSNEKKIEEIRTKRNKIMKEIIKLYEIKINENERGN